MKERFIEFLKNQGVYEKFLDNFNGQNATLTFEDFLDVQKEHQEWVWWAFVWDETPEKHNYWERLDDEWVTICEAQ